MRRLLGAVLLGFALCLAALFPSLAAAETSGSSPDQAIAVTGTMTGSLGAHQTRWYTFNGDGSSPVGVTMDYLPIDKLQADNIYFNVDWTLASGDHNADWPGYYRIGQGTPSGLSAGQRYWFSASSERTTYFVEVVNSSDEPIGYAIGLTGTAFPPPWLNPPEPGSVGPPAAATSTPTAVPAAPTATAVPTQTPEQGANTATDSSGVVLAPQVLVNGPFSTVMARVESTSPDLVQINRIRIRPPNGAVVDGVNPFESRNEDGVTWYLSQLVNVDNPLTGYEVRFYGPANGALVEVDWSSSTGKGSLTVTISGAPSPAPVGLQSLSSP